MHLLLVHCLFTIMNINANEYCQIAFQFVQPLGRTLHGAAINLVELKTFLVNLVPADDLNGSENWMQLFQRTKKLLRFSYVSNSRLINFRVFNYQNRTSSGRVKCLHSIHIIRHWFLCQMYSLYEKKNIIYFNVSLLLL